MDKAKQIVKQVVEKELSEELLASRIENLKPEINNFLWVRLPDRVTMKQAEALSLVIFEMCTNPDQFFET